MGQAPSTCRSRPRPRPASSRHRPPPPPSEGGAGAALPPSGGESWARIDWERWIGVRGAAVLGGVVLALAGILFVRYSIERGLISPALRVAMGILAGLGAIGWSERLRAKGYRINADALAGAGIVLLYAALWAAHSLYGFLGAGVAYGLMSLVTVACGVLSWRNASLLTAVLGLVGGFATPFLIATETENPIGLFGYVLLLDLGLIALGRRRGWSSLAVLALIGTAFYQAFWVFTRLRSENAWFTLAILALFALVFGLARWSRSSEASEPPRPGWKLAEGAGVMVPFALALHIASRADLGERLYPLAALLLILSLAAQWIARRNEGGDMLASGAAAGSLAVVLVWSWDIEWTPALVWELVAVSVALAAAFHLFFELDLRAARPSSVSILVAETGFLGLLILNAFSSLDSPWPWVAGFVVVSAMLVRLSVDPARAFTPLIAASGIAAGMSGWFLIAAAGGRLPAPEIYFGVVLLLGAVFQVLALLRAQGDARRNTEIAAAIYPAIVLAGLLFNAPKPALDAPVFLAVSMLLGVLLVLATTRLASGGGYLCGMVLLALVNTAWCFASTVDVEMAAALAVLARRRRRRGDRVRPVAVIRSAPRDLESRLASGRTLRPGLVHRHGDALPRALRRRRHRTPAARARGHHARRRISRPAGVGRGRRDDAHQPPGLVRRDRARLRRDRGSAPARQGVDHGGLGARGPGGDRALEAARSPRAQVLRRRPVRRRHREAAAQSGGARATTWPAGCRFSTGSRTPTWCRRHACSAPRASWGAPRRRRHRASRRSKAMPARSRSKSRAHGRGSRCSTVASWR